MDFFIIANAWSAGKDNPTSKHRIALELVRQGHRVLWIEGSGMRTPSVGSSSDRLRMVRKVVAALRGVRREEQLSSCSVDKLLPADAGTVVSCSVDKLLSESPKVSPFSTTQQPNNLTTTRASGATQQPNNLTTGLWVLSPLFIPLPKYEFIRQLNGLICRCGMRFWGWRLGFRDAVLINYVPVLAEAMRGRQGRRQLLSCSVVKLSPAERVAGCQVAELSPAERVTGCQVAELSPAERVTGCQVAELLSESPQGQSLTTEQLNNLTTLPPQGQSLTTEQLNNLTTLPPQGQSLTTEQLNNLTTTPRAPRVVYHCVDRWDAFAMYDSAMMGEMDRRCCRYADLVIASSEDLVERCRCHSPNVHLVSHGVDHEHFAQALSEIPRPADLPEGRIAGFFGLLSEWLDQDLLIEIAGKVPECEIVLIGREDVAIDRLKNIPNVHLLGPRPFNRLPGYVKYFDVGLIPFVVNELTKAVNPIKLREMMSAGCPVVSTNLPEVALYGGVGELLSCQVARLLSEGPKDSLPSTKRQPSSLSTTNECTPPVQIAQNHDEFVSMVRSILDKPFPPAERQAISNSMASETWTSKVGEILALLQGCGGRADGHAGEDY